MTSPHPPPPSAQAQTASPSPAGSGAPPAVVRSSYATATKGKQGPPAIVGHGKSNTASPVNGTPSPPAVAAPSGPPLVVSSNGPQSADHSRKPSSVTIQGNSGYLNGGPAGPSARPQMQFGAMTAGASPAVTNSVPNVPHNANLTTPMANSNPARTPSPIPQPTISGGRPPSGPQVPGSMNFGSFSGNDNGTDANRPAVLPQGPANQQHLRRDSSHSAHSDVTGGGRNFTPNNNRGRGFNQYPISQSPQIYRPNPAVPSRNMPNPQPFQSPAQMRANPNSPYPANRSPAMAPAAMQAQPQFANGPPMHPQYGGYLNSQAAPMYGVPAQEYGMPYPPQYYAAQYGPPNMHMAYGQTPPSPRPYNPPTGSQPFIPGQYQPPAAHMQRHPSQGGPVDRPGSALHASPSPVVPGPSVPPATGVPTSSSPGPAVRPERKISKAIVIKSADGTVVNLKDLASQKAAAATATTTTPPVVAAPKSGPPMIMASTGVPSTPTPPPKASETPQPPPKSEAQTAKEAEETKRLFAARVAASLKQSKESESGAEDSDKPSTTSETPVVKPVPTPEEKADAPDSEDEKVDASTKSPTPAESADSESADDEEDEMERMIREMEENERLEAERESAYAEKRKAEAEVRELKEKEEAAKVDEELRRAEREAEEREAAKTGEVDEESAKLFASLKKSGFGPSTAESSGPPTPGSDSMPPPSTTPTSAKPLSASRHRPQTLKLETTKAVEPAQPTAGMQSLRSARMLQLQNEISYPAGVQSPNPALNNSNKGRGFHYDKDFLLQFQDVFKEKPDVNWDKILKETVGDGGDSARPQSAARTPSMGGRGGSHRGGPPQAMPASLAMGNFGRTLPPGTTSADRFAASNQPQRVGPAPMQNPFAIFANRPTGMPFPVQAPSMARSGSQRNLSSTVNSGRQGSSRTKSKHNEKDMSRTMPLTAGKEVKALDVSKGGWKAMSITQPSIQSPVPGGLLPPDVVQRKVKAALNKMTPEKFDKISDDILVIANQSVHETDGRTLRQVIQLTFEKACDEAHWGPMYAKFCMRMQSTMSKDIKDEGIRDRNGDIIVGGNLFRKYLLNRCQEEFERGWEINLPPKPEGQDEVVLLSDEYYVAAAAKRRGLGLIQFIGELYKLGMLNIRIMHECVLKLLNFEGLPDESAIESLVKLLRTIGSAMEESEKGPAMINVYFDRINNIMHMDGLPSRLYYLLLDTVDLRRNRWKSKDDAKGPKTLTEIHREAQQKAIADAERAKTAARTGRPPMGRNDTRSYSGSPSMQPNDYSRNQVGMDDLKKLAGRNRTTGTSTSLGPSGLLSNRSGSGRRGLGPPTGETSGQSSRTGTPPVKESITSKNAFDLLSAHNDDVVSPPSTSANSPELSKTALANPEEPSQT